LVGAVIVAQRGYPVDRLDLNDGSVWVTNASALRIGRYNQGIGELTGGLKSDDRTFDIVQSGSDIAVTTSADIRVVDPALVQAGRPIRVGPEFTAATNAGTAVVVDSKSGVGWVRDSTGLALLRTDADKPDLEASGLVAAVGVDGTVWAVDGRGSRLVRVEAGAEGGKSVEVAGLELPGDSRVEAITAVGSVPVVLASGVVAWPGGLADLTAYGAGLALQSPGAASSTVRVASRLALLEVDLSDGNVEVHATGGVGTPVAPAVVDGCAHSAWASGGANYLLRCDGRAPQTISLEDLTQRSKLVLRVNRSVVVLNDVEDGRVWMPLKDTQAHRPNWEEIQPEEQADLSQSEESPSSDRSVHCASTVGVPQARDDSYGARPGQGVILTVLDNDSAAQCGALSIVGVSWAGADFGQIDIVYDARAVQFTADREGIAVFDYTVSDGRKDSVPVSGRVSVDVHGDSSNGAPEAVRRGSVTVEQGATVQVDGLAGFRDPDGDPMRLIGATTDSGLQFTLQPNGTITLTAAINIGVVNLALVASDGIAEGTGDFAVDVRPARSLAPATDPIKATAYTDQTISVDAVGPVRSGHVEPVVLAGLETVAGATTDVDEERGLFTFTASVPKTYFVAYVLRSGSRQTEATARIDVLVHPQDPVAPVAVVDVAHARIDGRGFVDPLANDLGPAGAVKVLSEVDTPADAGLKVAVIEHQFLEITPTRPSDRPIALTYTLATEGMETTGTVLTVVDPPTAGQPPVARNIQVTVRTGGVVTIPVMDYCEDPDGDELDLDPSLTRPLSEGQGLLFASGDLLRYQAPDTPVTIETPFRVLDPDGNTADARLTIRVHVSAGPSKPHPTPRDLEARTFAGTPVHITVPLTGIDVDGDGVRLQGLDTAPAKGRIAEVGPDYLVYEAFEGQVGNDTFDYAVEDWAGLRSTATVTVGIAAAPPIQTQVVARDDSTMTRTSERLEMRVLANDVDMAGGQLELCGVPLSSDPAVQVALEERRLTLTTPSYATTLRISYTACNMRGGSDSAVLTVAVDPNAPILAPKARDVIVHPRDTIERTSVEQDVLSVAENPSGPLSDLVVSLPPSSQQLASVAPDGTITVFLQRQPTLVAYKLTNTNPLAQSVSAYAFISVPALGTFPPMLRPGESEIVVQAGTSIELPLRQYVMVGTGKQAQVPDQTKIWATQAGAGSLLSDPYTLRFNARDGYSGPASITFGVADSADLEATTTRYAVLTLLITILDSEQSPPQFTGPNLEVARAGETRTVDLAEFTDIPGTANPNALVFRLSAEPPQDLAVTLSGTRLSVAARPQAQIGTTRQIPLTLSYGSSPLAHGVVEVEVVASQRALATLPFIGEVTTENWEPVRIDLLTGAINPASDIGPLEVVGVSINPPNAATLTRDAGSTLTVKPQAGFVGTAAVSYTANDSLHEPGRAVSNTFKITMVAAPSRPSAPLATVGAQGEVSLSWQTPSANGSPITEYDVTWADGGFQECPSSPCAIEYLLLGERYSFQVAAINAIGSSDPSPPSMTVLVDVPPAQVPAAAITVVELDRALEVHWTAPVSAGSSITGYRVALTGGSQSSAQDVSGTAHTFSGLQNGTQYAVTVTARNGSKQTGPPSAPVHGIPAGPPSPATIDQVVKTKPGEFLIRWTVGDPNGDQPRTQLWVSTPTTPNQPATEWVKRSQATLADAQAGTTYTFSVASRNKTGKLVWSEQVAATMWAPPPSPANLAIQPNSTLPAWGKGRITATWENPQDNQQAIGSIQLAGGTTTLTKAANPPTTFTDLTAGNYTITVETCLDTAKISQYAATAEPICAHTGSGAIPIETLPDTPDVNQQEIVWNNDSLVLPGLALTRHGRIDAPSTIEFEFQALIRGEWSDDEIIGQIDGLPTLPKLAGATKLRIAGNAGLGFGPFLEFDLAPPAPTQPGTPSATPSESEPPPSEPTPTPSEPGEPPSPDPPEPPEGGDTQAADGPLTDYLPLALASNLATAVVRFVASIHRNGTL
jgi:hypothetical protein